MRFGVLVLGIAPDGSGWETTAAPGSTSDGDEMWVFFASPVCLKVSRSAASSSIVW